MRIGFCGAGDTGKTTTAELAAKELGVPFIPGVTRGVFGALGITEADQLSMSGEARWDLQSEIVEAKIKQDSLRQEGVLDRTLLDHFVYCLYRCASHMDSDRYRNLLAEVISNLKNGYDVVFYVPAGVFPPPGDEFRQGGLAYQTAIDCLIMGVLRRFDLPYVMVYQTFLEDRVKFVYDVSVTL